MLLQGRAKSWGGPGGVRVLPRNAEATRRRLQVPACGHAMLHSGYNVLENAEVAAESLTDSPPPVYPEARGWGVHATCRRTPISH